jgi:hypothetical protein
MEKNLSVSENFEIGFDYLLHFLCTKEKWCYEVVKILPALTV